MKYQFTSRFFKVRPGDPIWPQEFGLWRRSLAQGNGRASAYPAIEKFRIGSSAAAATMSALGRVNPQHRTLKRTAA